MSIHSKTSLRSAPADRPPFPTPPSPGPSGAELTVGLYPDCGSHGKLVLHIPKVSVWTPDWDSTATHRRQEKMTDKKQTTSTKKRMPPWHSRMKACQITVKGCTANARCLIVSLPCVTLSTYHQYGPAFCDDLRTLLVRGIFRAKVHC